MRKHLSTGFLGKMRFAKPSNLTVPVSLTATKTVHLLGLALEPSQ